MLELCKLKIAFKSKHSIDHKNMKWLRLLKFDKKKSINNYKRISNSKPKKPIDSPLAKNIPII